MFFLPNVSLDLNIQTTRLGTARKKTARLITPNLLKLSTGHIFYAGQMQ